MSRYVWTKLHTRNHLWPFDTFSAAFWREEMKQTFTLRQGQCSLWSLIASSVVIWNAGTLLTRIGMISSCWYRTNPSSEPLNAKCILNAVPAVDCVISFCLSKSDTNYKQIASANEMKGTAQICLTPRAVNVDFYFFISNNKSMNGLVNHQKMNLQSAEVILQTKVFWFQLLTRGNLLVFFVSCDTEVNMFGR